MKKVDALIALATKALKLTSGETLVENAIRADQIHLVIVAKDASKNTKKKFTNMTNYRQIPYREYQDKAYLGHLIGKEYRATLAIMDENFAKSILTYLDADVHPITEPVNDSRR